MPSPHLRTKALATLLLLAVFMGPAAVARRIAYNTIDTTATLHPGGTRITLTGPLSCTQVEFVGMRVLVTQRTTGATAEGNAFLIGSPVQQQWVVLATVHHGPRFEPGPATAVALAISVREGEPTDAHQWLVPVTLQGN